jgi:hypothetical protein
VLALESEKISQRTKAGLQRARAKGKVLGRPRFSDGDRDKLRIALDKDGSWHAISVETRIPYATAASIAALETAIGADPSSSGQRSRSASRMPGIGFINGWGYIHGVASYQQAITLLF